MKQQLLPTPQTLFDALPCSEKMAQHVHDNRQRIIQIIQNQRQNFIVVLGPCSMHDPQAALDYARRLKQWQAQANLSHLVLVMRVYFEKPRTTTGWKGLLRDPNLNGTYDIVKGIYQARELLCQLNDMGISCGTEFLDPLVVPYLQDLIVWGAIGARTVESQIHRELASSLACPVGLKNTTMGHIQPAINAMKAVQDAQCFTTINETGQPVMQQTLGNPAPHLILRGGGQQINYDQMTMEWVDQQLQSCQIPNKIMVDCSHGNAQGDHRQQTKVVQALLGQPSFLNGVLMGLMLESHLTDGAQALTEPKALVYGKSITDPCLSWDDTTQILNQIAKALQYRLKQ